MMQSTIDQKDAEKFRTAGDRVSMKPKHPAESGPYPPFTVVRSENVRRSGHLIRTGSGDPPASPVNGAEERKRKKERRNTRSSASGAGDRAVCLPGNGTRLAYASFRRADARRGFVSLTITA
ncbi:MAG: hypothetical protein LBP50_07820 [Tannerella sp.]|nr:hypothetical protein [Tannerella sp.]